MVNTNPFRVMHKSMLRICKSKISDQEKVKQLNELWTSLKPSLKESERYLNNTPAFSTRAAHWNQLDIESIAAIKNKNNPWLLLKKALSETYYPNYLGNVTRELAWFEANNYVEDWIV